MSILTHFQPQQNSILPKANLRILNLQKYLGLKNNLAKLKNSNSKEREKVFQQSCVSLGNPESKYLLKKIRGYINRIQHMPKRRGVTQPRQSNLSSFKSSIQIQQQLSSSSLHNLRREQVTVERALLLNQQQKLQRIMLKQREEEQKQRCLSERIKIKLSVPRVKIAGADKPKPMQKLTWYKKWFRNDDNQKSRKKLKIFRKFKTQQVKRINTEQILSSIQVNDMQY